jgi:glycosyltransferase involved in cell wall biosynthesis
MNKKLSSSTLKHSILIITPALSGGGWISIEEPIIELIKEVKSFKVIVVALGPAKHKSKIYSLFRLPYFNYSGIVGFIVNLNPLFTTLYYIPLVILSFFLLLIYRPTILLCNGFCSALFSSPLAKIMKIKIIVSYHGEIEHYLGKLTKKIINIFSRFIDIVLVNSEGSKMDVIPIMDNPKKVIVVRHWANKIFFSMTKKYREMIKQRMRLQNKFVVLYVGEISHEKLAHLLLYVIEKLSKFEDFLDFYFIFVGTGSLIYKIREFERKFQNIKHFEYTSNREKLLEFYAVADIVWSFADTTYLARPAVEALATGTPVIIPDLPTIYKKAQQNIRIPHDLIPKDIGWIVNADDIDNIADFLLQIKRQNMIDDFIRFKCQSYARSLHSPVNMKIIIETIKQLCEK